MQHHFAVQPTRQPDALTLAASTWLASGIVLLGLTPLPLHDPVWGWAPAFWLLAAPSVLLLARRMCTSLARPKLSPRSKAPRARRERSEFAHYRPGLRRCQSVRRRRPATRVCDSVPARATQTAELVQQA